jgi:GTPase SAR1 family protein
MVGYYGSGKTSILNRFARNIFEPEYHMSLSKLPYHTASSSFTRLFSVDSNLSVKLKLIDSLGSGITKQMVNNGVSPSDALLLVYDLTKYP